MADERRSADWLTDRFNADPYLQACVVGYEGQLFVAVAGDGARAAAVGAPLLERCREVGAEIWPHALTDLASDVCQETVQIGGRRVGDGLWVLAGPCAVEHENHAVETARQLRDVADAFRLGLFKNRSTPYSFRGLGVQGREIAREIRALGMVTVTEVSAPEQIDLVADVVDCFQIDGRNMHNQALLRAVGATGRPVLLMRGPTATVDSWLNSVEHLLVAGTSSIVLCARGVLGYDRSLAFDLDLGGLLDLRRRCALPLIVDISHSTGRLDALAPATVSVIAFGACGFSTEAHIDPAGLFQPGDAEQTAPVWWIAGLRHLAVRTQEAIGGAFGQPATIPSAGHEWMSA